MNRFRRNTRSSYTDAQNRSVSTIPVRKLYVAPIKPNISHKIEAYFQTFGEVESIKLHKKDEFQYGFVQFKSADSARDVLSLKIWHRIDNTSFKVKAADSWHQPDKEETPNPLLVAPDQDSPSHILNAINDDCMWTIFQFLNAKELSIAANVCVRFKEHATEAFENKYLNLNLSDSIFSHGFTHVSHYRMLFSSFGEKLKSLHIRNDQTDRTLLNLINQYCSSNLKALTLADFYLTSGKSTEKRMKVFAHLEKLELISCEVVNCYHEFKMCSELRELRLDGIDMHGKGNFIGQKFAKLEKATFNENYLNNKSIKQFITSNKTLSHLSLTENNLSTDYVVQLIAQNLRNLRHLEVNERSNNTQDFQRNILQLTNLSQLSVLSLDFSMEDVNPLIDGLVAKNIPIEHLEIRNGLLGNQAINNICKLTQIKILKLITNEACLTDEHLIKLAEELPLMEELHMEDEGDSSFSTIGLKKMLPFSKKLQKLKLDNFANILIDIDDYKKILKIVQDRPDKIRLSIEIEGDGGKVSVPEETLAQHHDILTIDEKYDDSMSNDSSYDPDDSFESDWYDSDDDYDMYFDSDDDDSDGAQNFGAYFDGRVFFIG